MALMHNVWIEGVGAIHDDEVAAMGVGSTVTHEVDTVSAQSYGLIVKGYDADKGPVILSSLTASITSRSTNLADQSPKCGCSGLHLLVEGQQSYILYNKAANNTLSTTEAVAFELVLFTERWSIATVVDVTVPNNYAKS